MAGGVSVKILGGQQLDRKLASMGKRINKALEKRLDELSNELLARSTALVPEKTRQLLISAAISRAKLARNIFYDTPYALIMHESTYNLGPQSAEKTPTQDGPVGRKFLERPYNAVVRREVRKGFPRSILGAIRRRR